MELNIVARRSETIWVFDHEHQTTKDEPLCNGTEIVLDWYYEFCNKREPKVDDKLIIRLNTLPFVDPTTTLTLIRTNSYGSVYEDYLSGKEVWLCPWLQGYFGNVPETLSIICESYKEVDEELETILLEIIDEESK